MNVYRRGGGGRPWQRRCQAIFAMKGRACYICGQYATTVDHVKPRVEGGSDHPSNLQPCCAPCNSRRAALWVIAHQGGSQGALAPHRQPGRRWRGQQRSTPTGVLA